METQVADSQTEHAAGGRSIFSTMPQEPAVTHAPVLASSEVEDEVTYLSSETYFEGKLTANRNLGIDGEFRGEIHGSGDVFVGRNARIEADIRARTVIVEGSVKGVVEAEAVEIHATGRISGTIQSKVLKVETGGTIRGEVMMGDDAASTSPASGAARLAA